MTIKDVISNVEELNEQIVVYAKRIDGRFESSSEAVRLELSDVDLELPVNKVSEKYCLGFDYFLEGCIIREMIEGIRAVPEYQTVEQRVKRIIYYAEFDA